MTSSTIDEAQERYQSRPFGLGASDAPVACGVSPWKTPWQLCLEKLNLLQPEPMNQAMRLGIMLEPIVAELYEHATGIRLADSPIYKHPQIDWAFCSPDRLKPDGESVQIKTTARADGWGPAGTDEIPDYYNVQVHHEMACMERDACEVAVLIAGSDFRIYPIRRNEKLVDRIFELEREFWRRVETKDPPPPDYSETSVQQAIRTMYGVEEVEIELGDDANKTALEYVELGVTIKEFTGLRDAAKAQLLDAMKEANRAVLPDGTVLQRKTINRRGYTVEPTTYTDFRIRRPKQ